MTFLQDLPVEVLRNVCGHLTDHRPSLYSFALGSKQCYFSASYWLFRVLRISITDSQALERHIQLLSQRLETTSSIRHVRGLEISGCMDGPGGRSARIAVDWSADEFDESLPLVRTIGVPYLNYYSKHTHSEETEAWKPLATFVQQLPGLTDLVFTCLSHFPQCVLQAVEGLSSCRLHIRTFAFRNEDQSTVTADELAILQSTCLHSLLAYYGANKLGRRDDVGKDHQEEVVLRAAAGLARNLSSICTYRVAMHASPPPCQASNSPYRPWDNYGPEVEENMFHRQSRTPSALELTGHLAISRFELEKWSRNMDFSSITTLKLHRPVLRDALSWLSSNCSFSSLTTLVLVIDNLWEQDPNMPSDLHNHVEEFISTLPPLRKLELVAFFTESSVRAALDRHGDTLRELCLRPTRRCDRLVFDLELVEELCRRCHLLESLTMTIPRSKGHVREVAIYRTLGSLFRLRRLSLVLDASNPVDASSFARGTAGSGVSVDPSWDDFHLKKFDKAVLSSDLRNGHVADALINCALDENLARSIHRVILRARPRGAQPLAKLKLSAQGGCELGQGGVNSHHRFAATFLGREWLLQANPRNDANGEVSAEDLTLRKWEASAQFFPIELGGPVEPVFRSIWPRTRGEDSNWRDDWYSWPLQVDH